MLYELLSKYKQIVIYDEIRNESGKLMYMSAVPYTLIEVDENDNRFIRLSNKHNDILKIESNVNYHITHLKFNRDKIEIFITNKPIKLFAIF